jgi:DNA polymerase III delta prime subunit
MNADEYLWEEKYRPDKVSDIILPADLKATFQSYVEDKNIRNMILAGDAGIGKTTVAKSLVKSLDADYIVINGSLDRNIDTLRNEIMQFASSISFSEGRKYVIIDEADYLNATSTQPALRSFMEEFSNNCGFILTCNYVSKLIPALQSRCPVVEFKIQKKDMPKLAMQFMKRAETILETEGVKYDKKALAAIIQKWFPDFRRILGELQRYSTATGEIDSGILVNMDVVQINELIEFMKKKEYSNVRKWVAENSDTNQTGVYRRFYDNASDLFDKRYIPVLVTTIARYQYQAAFAVDPEINLSACLAEIMLEAQWA